MDFILNAKTRNHEDNVQKSLEKMDGFRAVYMVKVVNLSI